MAVFLPPDRLKQLTAINSSLLNDRGTKAQVARNAAAEAAAKDPASQPNPKLFAKNPLNISGLIAHLTDNPPASTNRFIVTFKGPYLETPDPDPKKQKNQTPEPTPYLSIQCESASFPGMGVETNIISRTYGPYRKMPTNLLFSDITFTFRCSEDHMEKTYFTKWMNKVVDQNTYDFGYYKDFIGTIIVSQLSRGGTATGNSAFEKHKVTLLQAYPVRIDEIPLDYNADNAIEKMNVTFSFYTWSKS